MNQLQVHGMKLHGHSMLRCENCDKEFFSRAGVLDHVRRVHKKKRFACEEAGCGKTFVYKAQLRTHGREQHKQPKLKCEACAEEFNSYWMFRSHRTKHHK